MQHPAGHLESAPDPVGRRLLLLHLYLAHPVVITENDGIKLFGLCNRKQQECQPVIGEMGERVWGEPDGVG
jgi:hypothetical protein